MKRILIIDDSEAVRRQVAQTLGPAGYDVVEAADGMEGLAVIKSAQPALVLCDLNMPRMGGMELLAELARNPPLPLMVMLTTEAQPALIRRARELGAVGWIVKPFKADLLIAAVNKLTARRRPGRARRQRRLLSATSPLDGGRPRAAKRVSRKLAARSRVSRACSRGLRGGGRGTRAPAGRSRASGRRSCGRRRPAGRA